MIAILALLPADSLSAAQLQDLTDEVNDYLHDALSVLKGPDMAKTQTSTIVAFLSELFETHTAACSADNPNDDVPHIISPVHRTKANIEQIVSDPDGILILKLDDGTEWAFTIEERS